jgi:cell division septal protein FtsQ
MAKVYRRPHRVKRKKPFYKNKFFLGFILILIIFCASFYIFSFASFFQIKEIQIYGEKTISANDLKTTLNEKIEKRIFSFLSKSIFLINPKKIESEFLQKYPKISKIEIKRKFPSTLILNIQEREPVAIFLVDDKKFFVDSTGIIFEETQSEDNFLKIKTSGVSSSIELGKKVITKELMAFILDAKEKIQQNFKIEIKEAFIVSEERVNLKTSEGWFLYLGSENLDWQLRKLKTVLEKEIPKEKRSLLEYIDTRFGNFASYKFRQ